MIYQPDEQDELIGDAEAVGGRRLVEQLQYAATAEADRLCPWDGVGNEPPQHRVAWLKAARRVVDERRAEVMARSG